MDVVSRGLIRSIHECNAIVDRCDMVLAKIMILITFFARKLDQTKALPRTVHKKKKVSIQEQLETFEMLELHFIDLCKQVRLIRFVPFLRKNRLERALQKGSRSSDYNLSFVAQTKEVLREADSVLETFLKIASYDTEGLNRM